VMKDEHPYGFIDFVPAGHEFPDWFLRAFDARLDPLRRDVIIAAWPDGLVELRRPVGLRP
jgi:hypothetical protein